MALIVKKSKILGSGKGLFTTKAIKKGAKIIKYRGEEIGWSEYNKRVKRDEDGYLFYFNKKRCIDAFHTPQYKARYANDANGFTRIKGLKNNSEYEIFGDDCYIVSTRESKQTIVNDSWIQIQITFLSLNEPRIFRQYQTLS